MKKHIKKVLSCIMATVLCLSFNATAFASEATEPAIEQSAQSQNADICASQYDWLFYYITFYLI